MRRTALSACLVVLALSGVVALAAPGGGGERVTAQQTRPADLTLEGVDVDFSVGGVLFASLWSVPAGGGSATWTPPFGTASYQFALPASIPSTGAPVTLGVSVTAAPTARFAPALGLSGDVDIQGSATQVGALAEPGQGASGSLTVTLVPRASAPGSLVTLTVGLQDGPQVRYRYRAADPCAPGARIAQVGAGACPVPKCAGVPATIVAEAGIPAPIFGTPGRDVIVGSDENDQIFGRGGDDLICGRGGNDLINGNAGRDTMNGEGGDDTVRGGGDEARDRLGGQTGDDRLLGGPGPDFLYGGTGNDRLLGELGNDGLSGGPGFDRLFGGRGSDLLAGEKGPDFLDGGSDAGDRDQDIGNGGVNVDTCVRVENEISCEESP